MRRSSARRTRFHDEVEEEPVEHARSHREHVERTRARSFSYRNFRGKAYAKKADLEANVIHYVLQYARIINEILRIPRIPDREAEAKTKRLTDAFKLCVKKNVDNALEDASNACCVHAGVKFEACRDLSRKLLASLKELKAFMRDEDEDSDAFEAFVKKHLSSKELSSLWSLGRATSRGLVLTAAAVLLVLAYQYGVFPAAAEMLHLDAGLGARILGALRNAGSGLHQGLGDVRASVMELLRPIQETLMISNIMGAAAGLGAGVSHGVSQVLNGNASHSGQTQTSVPENMGTSPRSPHELFSRPSDQGMSWVVHGDHPIREDGGMLLGTGQVIHMPNHWWDGLTWVPTVANTSHSAAKAEHNPAVVSNKLHAMGTSPKYPQNTSSQSLDHLRQSLAHTFPVDPLTTGMPQGEYGGDTGTFIDPIIAHGGINLGTPGANVNNHSIVVYHKPRSVANTSHAKAHAVANIIVPRTSQNGNSSSHHTNATGIPTMPQGTGNIYFPKNKWSHWRPKNRIGTEYQYPGGGSWIENYRSPNPNAGNLSAGVRNPGDRSIAEDNTTPPR